MPSLDAFVLSDKILEHIQTDNYLMEQLNEGKTLQEIFGFTNDTVLEFYEAAKTILEQKRFGEAVKGFSFLTMLNPFMSDFWMGLGIAQQNDNDFEAAVFSFSMAYTMEKNTIVPYMLAAECLCEIGNKQEALEVLQLAKEYAEEHLEEEGCKQLKEDSQAALQYVKRKK